MTTTDTPTNGGATPGTDLARTTTDATGKTVIRVPLGRRLEDMDQAWRLAQAFAAADIVPHDLKGKPANAFLIMLYGQRLNLPPEIAINSISVVKGRPRMSGQLLLAKVREAGHRVFVPCAECGESEHGAGVGHRYVAEHDDEHCTITVIRGDNGDRHSETFTLQDAVTAKLCSIKDGKPYVRSKQGEALPWENYPKRMLRWRAAGACVDVICPEVRMGFAVEDELDKPVEERPTLAQVAAERTDRELATAGEARREPEQDSDEAIAAQVAAIESEYNPETAMSEDEARAADLADIEAEHQAEYGGGEQP
jgi:hypothetical protein